MRKHVISPRAHSSPRHSAGLPPSAVSSPNPKRVRFDNDAGGQLDPLPLPPTPPTTRPPPPPPPPPPPGKQPQPPRPDSEPLTQFGGVAKHIQRRLQEDSSLNNGARWPCMNLFLTGTCTRNNCKTCAGNGPQRGDAAARAVAKRAFDALQAAGRIAPDLARTFAAGEKARA